MVVQLDAKVAVRAMERPRRSHDLASVTIAKDILNITGVISSVVEFVFGKESFNRGRQHRHELRFSEHFLVLVLNIILLAAVNHVSR